jgi:hypothetical protein
MVREIGAPDERPEFSVELGLDVELCKGNP